MSEDRIIRIFRSIFLWRVILYDEGDHSVSGKIAWDFSLKLSRMPIFGIFTPYEMERFRMAIRYIEIHYRDQFSAEQLAMEVGININLLRSGVFALTGTKIHRLIIATRLDKSVEQLAYFERSVKFIAIDNGFSSSSHFSREFKKRFGQTPTEYRFQMMNREERVLCK